MDPNAWQKGATNLLDDLADLLRDRPRAIRLVTNLANTAPNGRQAAWLAHAALVFAVLVAKRPSDRKAAHNIERRLHTVMFSGAAADAPARLQSLL